MSYYIRNENALNFIEELKENNILVDAIITDPPYNISRANNFKTINRAGIDFGSWDYDFDQVTWIKKSSPIVRTGGSILIFNDWRNLGEIANALEESGYFVKDVLRWVKNNPMPRNTSRRYVTDFEFAIWAVKGKGKWTFNFDKSKQLPYLRPEFKYSLVAKSANKIHPTQKSHDLLLDIIKIHTNKNDTIFDPFMGSGSTGIAALELKRSFIGTEINKKYFSKVQKRLYISHASNMKNKYVVRSPLYYLGDKYKLLSQIFTYFPEKINTFWDLFGGGGTLAANIQAQSYVYNDIYIYIGFSSCLRIVHSASLTKKLIN
ncbi:MAG: DNA adenine methylase [Mycoplasma sp.]|nr:DNA adenine methylase [Mycoplasma sp.]